MICESVPLREVLPHIEATLAPESRPPASAVVERDPAPPCDRPKKKEGDGAPEEIVFLLVKRRGDA